ncbi:MAG: NADP-dependent oxidoreductase [Solirubrobacteraceae bacterium]
MADASMEVAGIATLGGPVETFELPPPRPLAGDEVLVEVRCAGVANWDEIVRTGGWDVGTTPPMALGVEASGVVAGVGAAAGGWAAGDEVMTHPLPLRDQGTWTPWLIAPAELLARKPGRISWEQAAVFPVPALTALQVLDEELHVQAGEWVLVHGAGGVTGRLLVGLAALRGAQVAATASPGNHARLSELGAALVLDQRDAGWPGQLRAAAGTGGVASAANAVSGGAETALEAVADGGRLATITGDPPAQARGIAVANVYVRPDGAQLRELSGLLEAHTLEPEVAQAAPLSDAASALRLAAGGHPGGAIVLTL